MTDLITAEEAGKLAHKYRFANNDLERVLCETARTVIALHAQLTDLLAVAASLCRDKVPEGSLHDQDRAWERKLRYAHHQEEQSQ